MTDPVEPPDLDAIRERCDAATPGPWDARWAEPKDEPDRLAKAILLSTEHDLQSATSSTAWRLIAGDENNWVNLGFFGNGLTSKDNALFIAHAREDVPALAAALVAAQSERAEWQSRAFKAESALAAALVELMGESFRADAAEAERDRLREALRAVAVWSAGVSAEHGYPSIREFARAALDAQRPPEGDRSGRAGSARLNPNTTPEKPKP